MRRLQSFSGILPLGTYVIYHLWTNWAVVRGREQWVDRVIWVSDHFGSILEILFYSFLTVHVLLAIFGKAGSDSPLLGSRGRRRTQQVSGAVSLLFILYHIYHVWPWHSGPDSSVRDSYAILWSSLPEPAYLAIYLFGMTIVYFHFANGLSRAAVSWDLVSTERAFRVVRYAVSIAVIVLWGLTLQVIGHYLIG